MKRIISVATILLMMIAFVGCGGQSQLVGKWKVTGIEMGGSVLKWEESYGEVILDVNKDGNLSLTTAGKADGTGKWKEKDGKVTVDDRGQTLNGELKDGKLYLVIQGNTFIFEKMK